MASHKQILRSLGNNGPIKRTLFGPFGPMDREQLQLDYQAALRKDLEDASRRWGFDFFSEKPLDGGDFQWEEISATKVPHLYRSSTVGQGHLKRQRVVEVAVNSSPQKESILRAPQRCVFNHKNLEKSPEKEKDENGKLKRKQTNITDFYPAKRSVDENQAKRRVNENRMPRSKMPRVQVNHNKRLHSGETTRLCKDCLVPTVYIRS